MTALDRLLFAAKELGNGGEVEAVSIDQHRPIKLVNNNYLNAGPTVITISIELKDEDD